MLNHTAARMGDGYYFWQDAGGIRTGALPENWPDEITVNQLFKDREDRIVFNGILFIFIFRCTMAI